VNSAGRSPRPKACDLAADALGRVGYRGPPAVGRLRQPAVVVGMVASFGVPSRNPRAAWSRVAGMWSRSAAVAVKRAPVTVGAVRPTRAYQAASYTCSADRVLDGPRTSRSDARTGQPSRSARGSPSGTDDGTPVLLHYA
jgi:hypothetical protein